MMKNRTFYSRGSALMLMAIFVFSQHGYTTPHPLKMSVAILSFKDDIETYEVELRIFIDDLIVGVGDKLPSESVPWASVAPKKNKVEKYVSQHFMLSLNAIPQVLEFHAMEVEELTVAVTLRFSSTLMPADIIKVWSKDSILTSAFINQRNILHIDLPDKARRSLLFNANQQEVEINY